MDYKEAGVNIKAGYKAVELMAEAVRGTFTQGVFSGLGGFGGMFSLGAYSHMAEPVLVAGTDGVGTKLKLAFMADKHDTVGIDCVAMCVNDVVCCGGSPLFFLDYIAVGRNDPEKVAEIVKGVARGCKQAGCALIGGETAEMPGFYQPDEYDLAGFCVGIVDRCDIIDGSRVREGDALIGLASSGLHSNGFSLARKVFEDQLPEMAAELLTPTVIYARDVLELKRVVDIKGISHITGGGFYENIPRMLPEGLSVVVDRPWDVPPVFRRLQAQGGVGEREMFNTFNMGIGMALIVPASCEAAAVDTLAARGRRAWGIGHVTAMGAGVEICLT
ncbi:MAG: phosphoribosylformylglycinamidine cyclo-ligase [Clostridiales bacterium]|jgi:phosphoribosylformylglycinamidine cyclo-ligase|nr:phosphoribosylformylglycinamidine cyclo-ligase [Clostridiales bacterium]